MEGILSNILRIPKYRLIVYFCPTSIVSSFVDVVKVKAHNNVILDEDGNIRDVDVDKHFIDNVDKHKVVDNTEGDKEVIDDIVVSVEGVQEVVHWVAETVGEDKPTTSAPRDTGVGWGQGQTKVGVGVGNSFPTPDQGCG